MGEGCPHSPLLCHGMKGPVAGGVPQTVCHKGHSGFQESRVWSMVLERLSACSCVALSKSLYSLGFQVLSYKKSGLGQRNSGEALSCSNSLQTACF